MLTGRNRTGSARHLPKTFNPIHSKYICLTNHFNNTSPPTPPKKSRKERDKRTGSREFKGKWKQKDLLKTSHTHLFIIATYHWADSPLQCKTVLLRLWTMFLWPEIKLTAAFEISSTASYKQVGNTLTYCGAKHLPEGLRIH